MSYAWLFIYSLTCALNCGPNHLPQNIDDCVPEIQHKQAALTSVLPINGQSTLQNIQGFGGSSAWYGASLKEEQLSLFYDSKNPNYLGLTFLRIRITPDGDTFELKTAQTAQAMGAVVWGSPWTPPAEWKTNKAINNGGSLRREFYERYAHQQANFIFKMKDKGVDIRYLSVQNEPDYVAPWETNLFSPEEFAYFSGKFLGPILKKRGVTTTLLGPEASGLGHFKKYAAAIAADADAAQYIQVLATHDYDHGHPMTPENACKQYNKPVWMTEVFVSEPASKDTMDWGIETAKKIHRGLVNGRMNAWHYWWLLPGPGSSAEGLLDDKGNLSIRGHALAHYAKFVRPGARMLNLNSSLITRDLLLSAYIHTGMKQVVLVAINPTTSLLTQNIGMQNIKTGRMRGFVTNANARIKSFQVLSPNDNGQYVLRLPPKSIVTWVAGIQ
jgi:glucuronoarabinoxylan endo-1,4-beta-xylanase